MKIKPITELEVQEYLASVEAGREGEFSYLTHEDVFQELLARKKRRDEGIDEEFFPRIWPTLCEHFGGLRSEELTVLTGDSGKGKTTFALRYMLSLLQGGYSPLLFSLEEGFGNLSKRIGEMVLESPEKTWDSTKIGLYKSISEGIAPLYVYQPSGVTKQRALLNAMLYAKLKFGVRFVVLDNLGFVQLEYSHGVSEASAIGSFIKALVSFSEFHKVPIILIVHPAKLQDRGYKAREVGMDELKGSSDIKQLAHTVISLYPLKEETAIRFQKIRCSDYARNTGLGITFTYDHHRSWLAESCTKPQKLINGGSDD